MNIDVKTQLGCFGDYSTIFNNRGGSGGGNRAAAGGGFRVGGRTVPGPAGPRGGGVGIGQRGGTRGTPLARSARAPRIAGGARTLPRGR